MEKKPLRIALFTGLYAPFLTGVSVAVHQRVHWLLEQGHEVFLIHPQINKQYSQQVGNRPMLGLSELQIFSNFSSYAFPTQPLIFYKALPQPLNYRYWSDTKLLENFQPDIIVVEEAAQMRGLYSIFLQGYGRADSELKIFEQKEAKLNELKKNGANFSKELNQALKKDIHEITKTELDSLKVISDRRIKDAQDKLKLAKTTGTPEEKTLARQGYREAVVEGQTVRALQNTVTAERNYISAQKSAIDSEKERLKLTREYQSLVKSEEQLVVQAKRSGIVANMAYNTSLIGIIDSFKILRAEMNSSGDVGNKLTLSLRGAAAGIATKITSLFGTVGKIIEIVTYIIGAFSILDSLISINQKETQKFSQAVDQNNESIKTVTNTIQLYEKRSENSIRSTVALANAFTNLSDSAENTIDKFKKMQDTTGSLSSFKERILGLIDSISFGLTKFSKENQFADTMQKTVDSALEVAQKFGQSGQLELELKKILKVDNLDKVGSAFKKLTEIEKENFKGLLNLYKDSFNEVSRVLSGFQENLDKTYKGTQQFIQSLSGSDAFGKFAQNFGQLAVSMSELSTSSIDNQVKAFEELTKNPEKLSQFSKQFQSEFFKIRDIFIEDVKQLNEYQKRIDEIQQKIEAAKQKLRPQDEYSPSTVVRVGAQRSNREQQAIIDQNQAQLDKIKAERDQSNAINTVNRAAEMLRTEAKTIIQKAGEFAAVSYQNSMIRASNKIIAAYAVGLTGLASIGAERAIALNETKIKKQELDLAIKMLDDQESLMDAITANTLATNLNTEQLKPGDSAQKQAKIESLQSQAVNFDLSQFIRDLINTTPNITRQQVEQKVAEKFPDQKFDPGVFTTAYTKAQLSNQTRKALQGQQLELGAEEKGINITADRKIQQAKLENEKELLAISTSRLQVMLNILDVQKSIVGFTTREMLAQQESLERGILALSQRSEQASLELQIKQQEDALEKLDRKKDPRTYALNEEQLKFLRESKLPLIVAKQDAEQRLVGVKAISRELDFQIDKINKQAELEKSRAELQNSRENRQANQFRAEITNRQQLLGIDSDIAALQIYKLELLDLEREERQKILAIDAEIRKEREIADERKKADPTKAQDIDAEFNRTKEIKENQKNQIREETAGRRDIAGLTKDQQIEQGKLLETQKQITRQVELTAFVQNSYIDMIKELAPLQAAQLAYEQKLLEINSQDLARREKITESVEQAQAVLEAYRNRVIDLSAEEQERYELQKKQGQEQLARLDKEAAHQKQLALLEKQKSEFLDRQLKVREQMQHQQNLENATLEKTLATLKLTEASQVRLRDLQQRRNIESDYEIKRKQFLEADEKNREKLGTRLANLQQAQTKAGETLDIVGEDGSSAKISRSQANSEVERIKGLLAKDTTTEGLRALDLERNRRLGILNIETEKSKILASQNEQREQLNRSLDLETSKLDALLAKYQFSETMQVRLRTESQRRQLEQRYLSEDRLAEEARARAVGELGAEQQRINNKYPTEFDIPTDEDLNTYIFLDNQIKAINAAFITTRKENTALLEQEIEKLTIQEQTQLRQAKFNELLERTASIAEGLKGSFGSLGDRLGEFVTSLGAFTSTQTRNAETLAQSQGLIKQGLKERLEIEKELDVLSRKPGSPENREAIITAQTKLAAVKSKNKKLAEEDDKLRRKSLSEELAGAEKLAGNAKKLFKEKTAAHKAFHAVEKVIHIARLGMAAVQMAMDIKAAVLSTSTTGIQVANDATKASSGGVTAVINAVKDLGFPLNLIAGAATIAFIASILGSAFGGKSKAPSTFIPTAEQAQEVQGTAMGFDSQGNKVQVRRGVFGDTDAKSDSIRKGIETITKNSVIGLSYNNQMLETLRSIDRSIGSAARGLYSIPGLRTGSLFGTQEGKTGSGGWLLGKSSTQTDIIDSGIKLTGSFTQLADSAVDFIKVFETVKVTSSRSGFLGGLLDGILGGGGTETSTSIRERELNSSELGIARDIQNIFSSGIKFFEDIAARVGMSSGSVRTVLAGMDITQRTASLRGLKGDELQKEFGTVVSTIFDDASLALFASFKEFERFGETLTDTVIRVVDTNEKINQQLRNLGLTNQDALKELDNKATEKIVENFGDLETFISKTNYFFENFLTEEQRLMQTRKAVTEEFTRLGIAMPKTREEFANLVQTTDADSPLFLALMNLSEGFDQVQMAADQAAERVTDFDRKLKDLDPTRSSLDKLLDDLVLELGRFFKDQSLDTTKVIMFGLKSAKNILGSEIKQLYKTRKDEINASITELTNIKTKLTELRNTLIVGPLSNLTPGQQFLELQSRYKSTLADLQSSDKTKQAKAAEKFPGLAQEYLTSAQSLYASSSTFQNIRNLVLADLAAATTQIDSSLSIQERELNALETTIPQALKDIETNTANLDHITGLVNMYTAFNTAITALPSGLAAAVQAIRGGDVQTIIDTVLIALKLKEPPPPAADTGNTGNTGNTGSTAALPAVSTRTEAEIADYWNNTVGKILLPHEKMKALASYMSTHNISHSQIAKVFGIPESMVTSYLDLQDNLEIGRRLLEEVSDLSTENDNFTRNMLKTLGDINDQYVTRYLNDYDRYIDRWPELFNDTYYQNQLEQRYPNVVPMAKGGLTSPGLTLVGEEGPELVDFKTPGRVYTANQTKDLLDYPESLQYNLQYNLNKNMLDKLDKLLEAVNNGAIVNVAATKQNTEEIVEAIVDSNNKAIQANKLQQKIIIK